MRVFPARSLATALLVLLPGLLLTLPGGGAEPEGPRFQADRKGPGGSVILLDNCDASAMPDDGKDRNGPSRPDNDDDVINGPEDLKQVEPITVRPGRAQGPLALRLVNGAGGRGRAVDKVRVFNARGKEVLGNHTADTYPLTRDDLGTLADGGLQLYAEGLQFAATARLQLLEGDTPRDELVLPVAPFLLLPHDQAPVRNMVVHLVNPLLGDDSRASARYVADFRADCQAAGVAVQVVPVAHHDVWIQDEFEWGCTETPRCQLPVVLHLHRQRELRQQVQALLARGVGYFKAFDYDQADGDSMDFGGNLEVTPHTDRYPFGRVYYGAVASRLTPGDFHPALGTYIDKSGRRRQHSHISDGFREFFKGQKRSPADAQALQEPIELCTDWLDVGHVDEIVSFVPSNTRHRFALLWASPRLALDILKGLPAVTRQSPTYLDPRYAEQYGLATVDQLLEADRLIDSGFLDGDLQSYNELVDDKVAANVATFKRELGLDDDEVRPVPVLFANQRPRYWAALAITPGMVNLSSMGTTCLVPKPFIPAFQDSFARTLTELGQSPEFLDDWALYHAWAGEVHCGSNMLRKPFDRKWWQDPRGEAP